MKTENSYLPFEVDGGITKQKIFILSAFKSIYVCVVNKLGYKMATHISRMSKLLIKCIFIQKLLLG